MSLSKCMQMANGKRRGARAGNLPPGAQPKTPNEEPLTLLFAAIGHAVRPACVFLSWVKVIKRKARAVPCLFVIGRRLLPCPQAKRQHGLRAAVEGAVSVHAYRNFTPAIPAFHVTAIPVALLSSSDPQMSCQCMFPLYCVLNVVRISRGARSARRARSAPPYKVRFLISKAGRTLRPIAANSSVNDLSLGVFG